jgi:hypothetical protein
MAIAVVYIGQRKFDKTSRTNHDRLFELFRTKYEMNVYDFTRPGPSTTGPFQSSGGVQVWDFLQAVKQVNEDIIIKLRTDTWFTNNSMPVILSELDEIVNDNTDVAFMGVDFKNHYDKLHERLDASATKKITDFVVIAKKSRLDSEESIVTRLNGPKHKSGNVMFKYILAPDARAVSVSCQMYLIRKDYDVPNNWQIYSDWTSEYYKSEAAQQWVANNKKFIGKL